jgi:hypothetical protein
MPEASSLEAIRAATMRILPGAEDLGVDRHVVELVEQALPGFIDLIAALLNAYAAGVRAGSKFVELNDEERDAVFRQMSDDESQDIRDAIDALLLFTYGGMHSEWTGYDPSRHSLDPPAVWSDMGYHGPARAHFPYRAEDL